MLSDKALLSVHSVLKKNYKAVHLSDLYKCPNNTFISTRSEPSSIKSETFAHGHHKVLLFELVLLQFTTCIITSLLLLINLRFRPAGEALDMSGSQVLTLLFEEAEVKLEFIHNCAISLPYTKVKGNFQTLHLKEIFKSFSEIQQMKQELKLDF